jgi:peptidoglycan/LPS O-acetylase OafA/YrhL
MLKSHPGTADNLFALAELSCSSRLLQALLNTTLAVDTFFMISGLVTVVSFVRRCSSAVTILARPADAPAPEIDRLSGTRRAQLRTGNDYQMGNEQDSFDREGDDETQAVGASYSVNPSSRGADSTFAQAGMDGLEVDVTSVDSSSSAITSLSSSASSNRCIGLSSRSSSQKNFIANKSSRRPSSMYAPCAEPVSGWPTDFKPLSWLVMRYLRLTPAYAAIIGLSILMPALGSGPFWPETAGKLGSACRANWWTNLLYVNNFIETGNLCLIHSWYLSNDWQFFLVALVLFGLAYKSRKLALLVLLSLFVASSAATFIVSVENDYPPTIVTTSPAVAERWEFIHSLYYKPWPHLPPYLIGLLTGCLILRLHAAAARSGPHRTGDSAWPNPTSGVRVLCWILTTAIALAVLNSIYPWNMGLQVDPALTGLHSATFRTLWAACCAWLVFALVSRPRNPLALLLGWHGFQLTSRLTYCAYLVHPLVIFLHFGTLRERIDSSVYGQLHRFMGTLLMSYLLAFVVSICFESPFIKLQNYLARLVSGSPEQASRARHGFSDKWARPKPDGKPDKASGSGNLRQNLANAARGSLGANLSPPSSLLRSPDSLGSENQMPPLKLTRSQVTGQFIVRPADFASDDSRQMDEYSFAGAHRSDPRLGQQRARQLACNYHDSTGGAGCNQRTGPGQAPVDEEFQRKLAQAIGRGFKIRSKIVNGANKQSVAAIRARRNGSAKSVPRIASGVADSVPMFAVDAFSQQQQRVRTAHTKPHKPVVARRPEAFSTFVSLPPDGATTSGETRQC